MLATKGHLEALAPSIRAERSYVEQLHAMLPDVVDGRYIAPVRGQSDDVTFLQEHFFLILFDAVFRTLADSEDRLRRYGLLNLCVKGLVVSGDNLFDNEAKMDLPLALGYGPRFASIMQMLCFDHLVMRILETGDDVSAESKGRFRRELLNELASIGTLEGSEEQGVDEILPVEDMIRRVHEVRGGQLFALAMIAPRVWESRDAWSRWEQAGRGIWRLGTAFQIVDDLTDFEFDLKRRSHNVLCAQIAHGGTPEEKAALKQLTGEHAISADLVPSTFLASARAVVKRAREEAERGFADLAKVGFWFPPDDAGLFVQAIAGDAGDERMQAVVAGQKDSPA